MTCLTRKISLAVALVVMLSGMCSATALSPTEENTPKITFTEISREEYLSILAEEKGITYEEADLLDQQENEASYQRELERYKEDAEVKMLSDVPTILADVEKYIQGKSEIELGSGSFDSTLRVSFAAKAHKYTVSSVGAYIRFTEVRSVSAKLVGDYVPSFDENHVIAQIVREETHGNWLEVLVDGIAIHEIELSTEMSADMRAELGDCGFGIKGGAGTNYTYTASRGVQETVEFYSNDYYSDF